jgi:hypothetical protein
VIVPRTRSTSARPSASASPIRNPANVSVAESARRCRYIGSETREVAKRTGALTEQTKRLAAATEADVRTSQRALQGTIRPLLVGVPFGLPNNATTTETVRYEDGTKVQLTDRGQIDVAVTGSDVRLSAPFRNVGAESHSSSPPVPGRIVPGRL